MALYIGGTYALAMAKSNSVAITDFLFMVDLSLLDNDWWSSATHSDASKMRAYNHDSGEELAIDCTGFDITLKTGVLKILWSGTLDETLENKVRVYPPKKSNDSVGPDDPFGRYECLKNFIIASPSGGAENRSGSGAVFSEHGGVVSGGIDGLVGKATRYNGTSTYCDATFSTQTNDRVTMITSVKITDFIYSRIMGIGNTDGGISSALLIEMDSNDRLGTTLYDGGSNSSASFGHTSGRWYRLAARVIHPSNPADYHEIIIDGASGAQTAVFDPELNYNFCRLGSNPRFVSQYSKIHMQHVLIANFEISMDWLAFDTEQALNNASFWGEWETRNVGEDFCEKAITRLIEQFEQKTNIQKYLCALITPFDELRDVFFDLSLERNIETAMGAQLDGLGDIVGFARGGLNDDDYRVQIRTKIVINGSSGEVESVLSAMEAFSGGTFVRYLSLFPAGFILVSDGAIPSNIIQLLEQVAQAGVRIEVHATYGERSFSFAPDPGQPASDGTRGFSEPNYGPYAGLGGALTEKFS